jgi:hypothetical protein
MLEHQEFIYNIFHFHRLQVLNLHNNDLNMHVNTHN